MDKSKGSYASGQFCCAVSLDMSHSNLQPQQCQHWALYIDVTTTVLRTLQIVRFSRHYYHQKDKILFLDHQMQSKVWGRLI